MPHGKSTAYTFLQRTSIELANTILYIILHCPGCTPLRVYHPPPVADDEHPPPYDFLSLPPKPLPLRDERVETQPLPFFIPVALKPRSPSSGGRLSASIGSRLQSDELFPESQLIVNKQRWFRKQTTMGVRGGGGRCGRHQESYR